MSSVTYAVRPATSIAPASPAIAPDTAATISVVAVTGTPANAAARAFAPTARTAKPKVEYRSMTHSRTASATA